MKKEKQIEIIDNIRKFNRFYLAEFNLLNNKYLSSGFSLIEARILFEILISKTLNANFLSSKLNTDKGYLSRTVKGLENSGLIKRSPSKDDARFFDIKLTEKGKKVTNSLICQTNFRIGEIISSLSDEEKNILNDSMNKIMEIFEKKR